MFTQRFSGTTLHDSGQLKVGTDVAVWLRSVPQPWNRTILVKVCIEDVRAAERPGPAKAAGRH